MYNRLINSMYVKRSIRIMLLLITMMITNTSFAQFTIFESMKGAASQRMVLGGSAKMTSGMLGTGGDVSDPEGEGWLRLTSHYNNMTGYSYINEPFSPTSGVYIEFEYATWGEGSSKQGDGLTMFLFDAGIPNFLIGGDKKALGYGTEHNDLGLKGAYIGVALNETGEFASSEVGSGGDPNLIGVPSISLRGSENSNYEWIAGEPYDIRYNRDTHLRPTVDQYYRKVRVFIEKVDNQEIYNVTVYVQSENGSLKVISSTEISRPPSLTKLGFAGTTSKNRHYHEIRNVLITTPDNPVLTMTGPTVTTNGSSITYTIEPSNMSSSNASGSYVITTFPNGFNVDNIYTSNVQGGATMSYEDLGNNTYKFLMTNFPGMNSSGEIASMKINVLGSVLIEDSSFLTARSELIIVGASDYDTTNNIAEVSTTISGVDLTISSATIPSTIIAGKQEIFDIVVKNISLDKPTSTPITLNGTIPSVCDISGAINGQGWVLKSSTENTFVAEYIGSVAPNTELPRLSVPIKVSSREEPVSGLDFIVQLSNSEDLNVTNNDANIVTDLDRLSDIHLTTYTITNGGLYFVPGEQITYKINITNKGYSLSEPFSVKLTDDFLPQYAKINGEVISSFGGNAEVGTVTVSPDGTQLTIDNVRLDGAVDNNGFVQYSIPLYFLPSVIEPSLDITSIATINKDLPLENNKGTISLSNNPISDLQVVSYTSSVVDADRCQDVIYTIVAQNNGPSDFNSSGKINGVLPLGVTLNQDQTSADWTLQDNNVFWSFESMPVGTTLNKSIGAKISSDTETQVAAVDATVSSVIIDPNEANNIVSSNVIEIINPGIIGAVIITEDEVCSGTTINAKFTASGGVSPYSLSYTDGVNVFVYTDIVDVLNLPIVPINNESVNKTIKYSIVELRDANGVCAFSGDEISDEIIVTPILVQGSNNITNTGGSRFCIGETLPTITGSNPSGGVGTFEYSWYKSTDDITYSLIDGVNTKDYTPVESTSGTFRYKRNVKSGACIEESNIVEIEVSPISNISIEDINIDEIALFASIKVSLSEPSNCDVVLIYNTVDGTATGGNDASFDYSQQLDIAVQIPAGETFAYINIPINNDLIDELDETFSVILSGSSSSINIIDNESVVTIKDDDIPVTLDIVTSTSLLEGSAGTTSTLMSRVSFNAVSGSDISLKYRIDQVVDNGTYSNAIIGEDIDVSSQEVTVLIPSGSSYYDIPVTVIGDDDYEKNEVFTITLLEATNATIGGNVLCTATITNDDVAPLITMLGETQIEGGDIQFTINLSKVSRIPVTFTIEAKNKVSAPIETQATGCLSSESSNIFCDYGITAPVLSTIQPGVQSMTYTVTTVDDIVHEYSTEVFLVALEQITGAVTETLETRLVADGYITDNEQEPTLSFSTIYGAWTEEGYLEEGFNTNGVRYVNFTLSHPTYKPLTVAYYTVAGTAISSGGAISSLVEKADYVEKNTTISFDPGTVAPITNQYITILGDVNHEQDETFYLHIDNPASGGVQIPTPVNEVKIKNDDEMPTVYLSSLTNIVYETDGAYAEFYISLKNSEGSEVISGDELTINYRTVDGTAQALLDYQPINSSDIFEIGQTNYTVRIPIIKDSDTEVTNEVFSLELHSPDNLKYVFDGGLSTLSTSIEIKDVADDEVLVTLNDKETTEGSNFDFTLTLSNSLLEETVFKYRTRILNSTTQLNASESDIANLGTEFEVIVPAGGALDFPITISSIQDDVYEKNEVFGVELLGAFRNGVDVSDQFLWQGEDYNTPGVKRIAVATIIDDENVPYIAMKESQLDFSIIEGEGDIPITLVGKIERPIIVNYVARIDATDGVAAIYGQDFIDGSTDGVIIFTAADSNSDKNIKVVILNDDIYESLEYFRVRVTNILGGAVIDPTPGSDMTKIVLHDDDLPPVINIVQDSFTEPASGSASTRKIFIEILGNSDVPLSFDYQTVAGTAIDQDSGLDKQDYLPINQTFSISTNRNSIPGQSSVLTTVPVIIYGDGRKEDTEEFTFKVLNLNEVTAPSPETQISIVDEFAGPEVLIYSEKESINESESLSVVVSLSKLTDQGVRVFLALESLSPSLTSSDYQIDLVPIEIQPGEKLKNIDFSAIADNLYEGKIPEKLKIYIQRLEYFGLDFSPNPGNAVISSLNHEVNIEIFDIDTPPIATMLSNLSSVTENDILTLSAKLDKPTFEDVNILVKLMDYTTKKGVDYILVDDLSGIPSVDYPIIKIKAGQLESSIVDNVYIQAVSDGTVENVETFSTLIDFVTGGDAIVENDNKISIDIISTETALSVLNSEIESPEDIVYTFKISDFGYTVTSDRLPNYFQIVNYNRAT